jgi:hypothetical protein
MTIGINRKTPPVTAGFHQKFVCYSLMTLKVLLVESEVALIK